MMRLQARLPWRAAALTLTLAILAGCDQAAEQDASPGPTPPRTSPETPSPAPTPQVTPPKPTEGFGTAVVRIRTAAGEEHLLGVEVAAEPAARQQGLMHRETLPRDQGMLFVFPDDNSGGFWMKDTLIPLSIAFVDADGTILRILDMEPCEADPCPSYNPEVPYRLALEVNESVFSELGVDEGDRLDVPDGLPPAS